MACLPGMPCYDSYLNVIYPKGCAPFKLDVETKYVRYSSDSLSNTGITMNDNLEVALEKIDATLTSEDYIYAFLQIIQSNELLRNKLCEILQECTTTTTTTELI